MADWVTDKGEGRKEGTGRRTDRQTDRQSARAGIQTDDSVAKTLLSPLSAARPVAQRQKRFASSGKRIVPCIILA